MRSIIKASLLTCEIIVALTCSLAEAADIPFTVPAALMQAGAPTLNIPVTNVVTLTAEQLTAAQANNTIVQVINNAIKSNTLIQFPAGTYNIPAVIFVSGVTNVILQGAVDSTGAPITTLNFTKSLTELYGNNTNVYGSFGAWHGGGGLITIGTSHPLYNNGPNKPSTNVGIKNFKIQPFVC